MQFFIQLTVALWRYMTSKILVNNRSGNGIKWLVAIMAIIQEGTSVENPTRSWYSRNYMKSHSAQ